MFRIECFVTDDKKLGEVLTALARIRGVSVPAAPQPVGGATVRNGKVAGNGAGTACELVLASLRQAKAKQFTYGQAREVVVNGGYSAKSVGSVLSQLVADKVVRRLKTKGNYEVRS